ncbi:hypothetical protein [Neorhizobium sp. AL 9.2.2]|uniref:hypothetical protein n=1 Tax=Neorhizobium sp. AL 9.2.2 TaxID=2712894 RepID=UPI001571BB3E|nr:hypothetical protein [Neorhizobium sp. AL 9.2.2]NSY20069.1 hypothetical protein [Neorhizobium sp. AL 9.2.2]
MSELISVIVGHAPGSMKRYEQLTSRPWAASRLDGTGWSFWFTRKNVVNIFH